MVRKLDNQYSSLYITVIINVYTFQNNTWDCGKPGAGCTDEWTLALPLSVKRSGDIEVSSWENVQVFNRWTQWRTAFQVPEAAQAMSQGKEGL